MSECKKCGKCFRDKYDLSKHMSRKIPCIPKVPSPQNSEISNDPKIDHLPPKIDHLDPKIDHLPPKNDHLESKVCMFCLSTFSTSWYKNKHQNICKMKDDPVRLLEIENGVDPPTAVCKTECRFCNKDFCRTSNLNKHYLVCKERKDYLDNLNYHQKQVQITNNNIVNNNIVNNTTNNNNVNIIINILGNEDTSHIDIERIINNLRDLQNNYESNQIYLKAGQMVISYDDLMREVPENQNVIIPSSKSIYTSVKTENGWEMKETDEALNRSFKNSAKKLYETKESIEAVNKRVFQDKSNKKIFNEVEQFAKSGLKHTNSQFYEPNDQRKLKSSYKISKIKKKKCDF